MSDAERIKILENAIGSIWKAYCVVSSNGGAGWQRHVEPAIYEAVKLLPRPMRMHEDV